MSLDRMLTLAGFDKKAEAIAALKESKRQLSEAHDVAIKQVERGISVDEGLMTGLRAAVATIASGSVKATKSIARKASELSDNVKKLYQDEKCKIELKEMLKGMVALAGEFEKLEKNAPTILKKDERVREIVKVFRDAMDTMKSDLQARALPPDRVAPTLGESEVQALLDEFLAEEQGTEAIVEGSAGDYLSQQIQLKLKFKAAKDFTVDEIYSKIPKEPSGWDNGIEFDQEQYSTGDMVTVSSDSSSPRTASCGPIVKFIMKHMAKQGCISQAEEAAIRSRFGVSLARDLKQLES